MSDYEHHSEKLGYIDLEDLDGKDGPDTQKAVRELHAHTSIKIDGIVGPETRQALVEELAASAEDEAPAAEEPTS